MFYTYVLLSEKDGSFYVGYTKDLKERIQQHKSGQSSDTSRKLRVVLVYYEACLNKYDAVTRENYFKSGYGRRFLKNRLENYIRDGET